jgi:hypothetical protein
MQWRTAWTVGTRSARRALGLVVGISMYNTWVGSSRQVLRRTAGSDSSQVIALIRLGILFGHHNVATHRTGLHHLTRTAREPADLELDTARYFEIAGSNQVRLEHYD